MLELRIYCIKQARDLIVSEVSALSYSNRMRVAQLAYGAPFWYISESDGYYLLLKPAFTAKVKHSCFSRELRYMDQLTLNKKEERKQEECRK